ncbi:MAG TPA: nucleotide exchange factor GrpE, partial [Phaeodactylibacter sp.]|nr:nucleotide exchange factor GrpE [Phaeodactylibacter sp.]
MSKKEKNTSHKKETKSANNKHEQEVIEQEVETTTEEQPSKAADNTEDILTEKDKEIAELKDKYMRLMADFDNFRKRVVKEKMQLMDTAAEDTMTALLPVLDDFDRAKAAAACKDGKEPFSEGVSLVYNKLFSTLKQKGLE